MYLPTRPASPRRGLSLLEVLVALTIFLLSFVAIGRLVTLASDRALDVEQQSQATRLAQSKLNEVVAGALPLQGASGSFDEDPDWQWSVDAEPGSVSSLWTVTVTVSRPSPDGDITSTLSQMVLDPSARGSAFDQINVSGTDTSGNAAGGDTSPSSASASPTSPGQTGQPAPAAGAKPAAGGTTTPANPTTGGTTPGGTKPTTGGTTPSGGSPSSGGTKPTTGGTSSPSSGGSPSGSPSGSSPSGGSPSSSGSGTKP